MASTLAEFTNGELMKLVAEEWIGKVTQGIANTIEISFDEDVVLRPVKTKSEIESRFRICIKWFVTLRRELHWSVPRILDTLPIALRTELEGGKFNPDENRNAWHGEVQDDELVFDGDDMVERLADVAGIEANDILGE